jgi:PPE-repeat protein
MVMLDFAQLPPEINSALLYTGPGSGPMLAAAAAWERLAAELHTIASSYEALITGLTDGPWQGPAAASMAAAAAPQVAWLRSTAGQAEQVAAQAVAAAGAYEAAFAQTVPPPEIAANRALLMALLATNFLGQNTAAIAATEAQYAEMWAQDATAMYGYAGSSAQATTLPSFGPSSIAAGLAGVGAQVNAVANALHGAANAQGLYDVPRALFRMAGLTSDPPLLNNYAAGLGLTGHTWTPNGDGIVVAGMFGDFVEGLTGSPTVDGSTAFDSYIRLISPLRLSTTASKDVEGLAESLTHFAPKAAEGAAHAAEAVLPALGNAAGGAAAGLRGAVAGVGNALPIGGLSVPASWAGSAPVSNPIVVTAGLNGLGNAAAAEPATSAFGGMPMMGAGGGRAAAGYIAAPRYGFKPTVVSHPLAGG